MTSTIFSKATLIRFAETFVVVFGAIFFANEFDTTNVTALVESLATAGLSATLLALRRAWAALGTPEA